MPSLKTETVTLHTLTLTDAELTEVREAALCAMDLGGPTDEHLPTWRMLARLGKGATRGQTGSVTDEYANPSLVGR